MSDSKRTKDDAAILALACGASIDTAAQKAGISKRTLQRRMADPGFRRKINDIRNDMVQRHSGTLTAAGTEAVKTLLDLLKPTHSGTVRLGAARSVLEIGVKFREAADTDERLATNEEPQGYKMSEEDKRLALLAILDGCDVIKSDQTMETGAMNPVGGGNGESESPAYIDVGEVMRLFDRK